MKVKGKRTGQHPNKSHTGAPPWPPYNQRALKVLIVGCGRVGSQVAADMDRSGHDVVIIDRDPNQFSRASCAASTTPTAPTLTRSLESTRSVRHSRARSTSRRL